MKKLLALLLSLVLTIGLVGCVGEDLATEPVKEEVADKTDKEGTESTEDAVMDKDIVMADEIRINFALGNNNRTMTYNQAAPLELPDGTVITQGDLKATWQEFESRLGFDITDSTVQDQKSSEMIDIAAAVGFEDSNIYGGSGIAEKLMNYGAQGYFLNLNDYLGQMPNFGAFLEENPSIATAITAYDGGIYHVPYSAEIGNLARIMLGREEWATALLDGPDMLVDESATLMVAYEGFWDRQDTNVADLQNAAATGGKLSRDVALDTLLSYIADTYPEYTNPSELYIGGKAQYDMDELVALWRVVKLSPNTLTKVSTGAVIDGASISPFFPRKTAYREDILRLAAWYGQRVHGSDGYGAKFYLDADGELQFSYAEEGMMVAVDKMKDMFDEGLIYSEFADTGYKDEVRKEMYAKDTEDGHMQFGFMTYDWIQSTTASNADVVGMLPPMGKMGSDDFIHFSENTRVIKPDGWSISSASTEEEINSSLALFDYMYDRDGQILQIYGVPAAIAQGETFLGSDGIEYPKFSQWLLDKATEMKSGDVSGFLRDFLGSLLPIGYQKEIGFELQGTINNGPAAWDMLMSSDVQSVSYGSEDPLFRLVPPVFSMTDQDLAKLSTLSVGEDQVEQIFLYITGANGAAADTTALRQIYLDAGIEDYADVYRTAYKRIAEK